MKIKLKFIEFLYVKYNTHCIVCDTKVMTLTTSTCS